MLIWVTGLSPPVFGTNTSCKVHFFKKKTCPVENSHYFYELSPSHPSSEIAGIQPISTLGGINRIKGNEDKF